MKPYTLRKDQKEKIREKIARVLENEPHVLFAYLFGSYARGTQTERSDMDIAVYLDNEPERDPLYSSRLALQIEKSLDSTISVDLRILNGSPVRFRHQVLISGTLIHSKNERARITFEAYSISRYMDFKPYIHRYNKARMERLGI